MLNTSGVIPLDLRVVVMPDPAETKTAGGIIIPETVAEREKAAAVKGTLVAMGDNAFTEGGSGVRALVSPGKRVMIGKYAGVVFKGTDGNEYRIMNDTDVVGLLTE